MVLLSLQGSSIQDWSNVCGKVFEVSLVKLIIFQCLIEKVTAAQVAAQSAFIQADVGSNPSKE